MCVRAGGHRKPFDPTKMFYFLRPLEIAPTDTASKRISELRERLTRAAGKTD